MSPMPSFQSVGLAGLDRVIHKLNQEIAKIEGATLGGLIRAAIVVRRSMENDAPKTPVDIGNLRASFFVVTSKGKTERGASPNFQSGQATHKIEARGKTTKYKGRKVSEGEVARLAAGHSKALSAAKAEVAGSNPKVMLGFSAYYAVFVHEMMGPINWTRPGSGPKWFQSAFRRNVAEILNKIKESARIQK